MRIAFIANDKGIEFNKINGCSLNTFKLFNLLKKGFRAKLFLPDYKHNSFFRSFSIVKKCKNFDLIYERYSLYSVAGYIASKLNNIPLVVHVHSPLVYEAELFLKSRFNWLQKKIINFTSRKTFQQAKAIIVVSKENKYYLVKKWSVNSKKIFVVPNAVDVKMFSKQYNKKRIRSKYALGTNQIVIFVGSFFPWSGISNLIKAFSLLKKKNKKVKLLLVGDGKLKKNLKQEILKLGIKESVILTSYVPHNEIPKLLSIADIAVLPYSRIKNFYFSPLKLFEYMAARKAIIASDQGQIRRTIKHGESGILFEPGNIKELSKAITELLSSKKKRDALGRKAFQKVKDNNWENYINKVIKIFSDIK